jgi:plasmid stabilization system protein ParE
MAAKIRWSGKAEEDYHLIIQYLAKNWNEEIAIRFIEITEHKIQQVSKYPFIGI